MKIQVEGQLNVGRMKATDEKLYVDFSDGRSTIQVAFDGPGEAKIASGDLVEVSFPAELRVGKYGMYITAEKPVVLRRGVVKWDTNK